MNTLRKRLLALSLVSSFFLLAGCASVKVEEYANTTPRLDIAEYFTGQTRAWGMVQDYSGEVQRRFTVDITGTFEGDTLTLDESFVFADGETDQRVWEFERVDEHHWIGTANDVDGQVDARQYGHAFHMRYPLDIDVGGRTLSFTMDDWMYLQPDGRLINRTAMRKFGLTLGEITLVFEQVGR
ncbi:DUF3833 domain-containing protein [Halomonas meridiana]|uniref:Lipoprotein n=1 Tax=Vreelandella aquamarina TaxID=77097 RepID=A0A857GKT3_9GAMM|nr:MULTISPECIES: DUF3833 domain-containing protein [Halomonas]MAO61986.1 hypothetical protein [Halomonas sp.]MDK9687263.1 DUF3833 domain-containing protein [Halomonas sp. LC1]MDP4558030.1 DUF3833 domain-containing protein [Halomonas meridiana]QHD49880.1 hypothetical protein CTT34_09365 [Halomonas meridiana]HAZ98502.1 DUF3833 domain-containing protein [Halomonas sp.]|tara:strand:- start:948 stop:1496 length:549 start_codon:yes stop_codon:yes gene_type:complete